MEENQIVPQTDVNQSTPEIQEGSFNPEAFGDDILSKIEAKFPELVDQVSAKTRDEIISKIVGEQKKEPEKYVPESYEELMERTVNQAIDAFEKKQLDTKSKEEALKKEEEEKAAKIVEANNEYWDKQLQDLQQESILQKLPDEIAKKLAEGKELTEEERAHPAVSSRSELYAKSRELKDKGDADWWNLKYVAYRFGIGKEYRGANAPVYGKPSFAEEDSKVGYSYEDIHNMTFQDIAKAAR